MLPDNPLGGVTYARFFPSDWRSGCFNLNLEEEGLYIRSCAWMYDTGQAIPGNDATAAKLLNVQVQKYTKVMSSLIEKGKMIRAQGMILNKRVVDEIDKFRMQQNARSEAAKKRERDRKNQIETDATRAILNARNQGTFDLRSGETPPPTPLPTPPPTWGGLPGGYPQPTPLGSIEGEAKKDNENNECGSGPCQSPTTTVADAGKSRIQKPLREEKKEKEKDQSINQSRGGGRASDDGVPGEGSIDPELGNAIRLLAEVVGSPEDPDFEKADRLAKRWAATDGARAVLDATLDWIAKKSDRSEFRAFSEALFGGYVRQAVKNASGRDAGAGATTPHGVVQKPATRLLSPGDRYGNFTISGDGQIEIEPAAKLEWLRRFGNDAASLDLAMIGIKGKLRINSPTPIEAQIEGMLSDRALDIRQRSRNYQEAAERNRSPRPTKSLDGSVVETQSQRLARIAKEYERELKQ